MEVLRSIFGRKTASANGSGSGHGSGAGSGRSRNLSSKLKGKSYDSAIALDPPVKGLYPVAGNGPNLLDELQRSKAHRNTLRRQSVSTAGYAEPPNVPRWREDIPERPRTAPHSGMPSGHLQAKDTSGRAMSGFAVRASPFVQNPPDPQHRSTASVTQKPVKEVIAYQPKRTLNDSVDLPPPNLRSFHNRTESTNSRASYIDLLDAYSNLVGSRDALTDRIKASGRRDYGEDVADRNIVEHGGSDILDQSTPQSSYYRKNSAGHGGSTLRHTRLNSAVENVLEDDDDTQPQHTPLATRIPSQSQSQIPSSVSGSRPANAFPPRVDSVSTYQNPRGRIDDRTRSMRRRTLSTSSAVIHEEPSSRASRRQSLTQAVPSSSFSTAHERTGSLSQDRIPPRYSSSRIHIRQDSAASTAPNFSRRTPISPESTASPSANESRTRPRRSSTATTDSASHPRSKAGPSSYVGFPSSKRSSIHTVEAKDSLDLPSRGSPSISTASQQKRLSFDLRDHYDLTSRRSPPPVSTKQSRRYSVESKDHYNISSRKSPPPVSMSQSGSNRYLVEGAKEAPSLEGIVDLNNSVDTEVTTRQAPAVIHEYVTPKVHHVREEVVTREIHTHDVFHRVLPVIETEVLPTKHYIQLADGTLKEIPADQVPGRTTTPSFQIVPTERAHKAGETLPGGSIVHIGHRGPDKGPVLSSQRQSITKEGVPKTEYVWRHAPTLSVGSKETGQSVPMYFNDGSESDEFDPEYTTGKKVVEGDDMLFRDSGYGSGGMLPGLAETVPTAVYRKSAQPHSRHARTESNDSSGEGEATKALKRRKEAKEKLRRAYEQDGVSGVTRGMQSLNVNDP